MSRPGPKLLSDKFRPGATKGPGHTAFRQVPTVAGNLSRPVNRTSRLGLCLHCLIAIDLAWNSDAGEVTIAHRHPVCGAWQEEGVLILGRAVRDSDATVDDALDPRLKVQR